MSKSLVLNTGMLPSRTTIRHKVADSAEVRHKMAARSCSYGSAMTPASFDIGISAVPTPLQDVCDRFPVGM